MSTKLDLYIIALKMYDLQILFVYTYIRQWRGVS